jgi:hypothetical protein|tara:strand:- start:92 stop:313 length:222 start_codon:yes stop_codon:yes gene_type:complete
MNRIQQRRLERARMNAEAAKAAESAAGAKLTEADLKKMTKAELEGLGRSKFNIELDKRKTKDKLVSELLDAQG